LALPDLWAMALHCARSNRPAKGSARLSLRS
jgi:hypothetical protein